MIQHTFRPASFADVSRSFVLSMLAILLMPQHSQAQLSQSAESPDLFEKSIRPILTTKCAPCHSGTSPQGGFGIDSRLQLVRGGTRGPAINIDKPESSVLIRAMRGVQPALSTMPPSGRLSEAEIGLFVRWIASGAIWPAGISTKSSIGKPHWAFQPLASKSGNSAAYSITTAIDTLLTGSLPVTIARERQASKRTLIRRAYYDLTGLPPTFAQVQEFERDTRPNAYSRLIDRLLASPQYGEQYGRHWLDVVRYADTAGENTDHPIIDAWKYRNWVIQAFNKNMPFTTFIKMQIAGDIIAKNQYSNNPAEYADSITATGYLASARRFGHDIDQDMHLTYEDTIDNLGKSFLGLSLGCARCHDHKFDPISAKDYYALYGIFSSTKLSFPGCEPRQQPHDMVPLIPASFVQNSKSEQQTRLKQLETTINVGESQVLAAAKSAYEKAGAPLASGTIPDGGQMQIPRTALHVSAGDMLSLYVYPIKSHGADSTLVDLSIHGSNHIYKAGDIIDSLLKGNPNHGTGGSWHFLDGQGNQLRHLGEKVQQVNGNAYISAWRSGETPSVFVNTSSSDQKVWTTLPAHSLFVHPGEHGPVVLSWVSPISEDVAVDGYIRDVHPGGPDGVSWELRRTSDGQAVMRQLSDLESHQAQLTSQLKEIQSHLETQTAYAAQEGTPSDSRLQRRGEPGDLGEAVPRGFPAALGGHPIKDPTQSGRLELADWIASAKNPLTARVIVNRLWQWHFGTGLVKTPNDFGTRGAAPDKQLLLDTLAKRFIEIGWDIKRMNREIMLSKAYRAASSLISVGQPKQQPAATLFPSRRLSAEELRDSLLLASGQLDPSPGKEHPFPAVSTWSFTQHQPFAAEYSSVKRSVYLMQKRNRRIRFFALFDGPDPNASTAVRDVTTVPTQALYFLNDPFVFDCARRTADISMRNSSSTSGRVGEVYRHVLQRVPSSEEIADALTFMSKVRSEYIGETRELDILAAFTRTLLASNEFITVD